MPFDSRILPAASGPRKQTAEHWLNQRARRAKWAKYRWKTPTEAAIFNTIKKLTTAETGANLNQPPLSRG